MGIKVAILFTALFRISVTSAQVNDTISGGKNVELKEVEIIGERTPTAYSKLARKITVITNEDIKSSPASTIQDLLEYAASIDIRQRNTFGVQADIQFRGGTFDDVMVLLNGINITDPQTGHFNLDLPVDLSSVDHIEILNGSGARVFGANAYKGVINIITRKNFTELRTGIDYGQYGLIHPYASAGITKGAFYSNINLSRNISKGFAVNTDFKINHFYYQGGVNGKLVNIDLQAGLNGKKFGANDFYSPSFPEQYEETSAGFGSLSITTKGKIKLSGAAYWREHTDNFMLNRDDPAFYNNHHLTDIYGIKLNTSIISVLGKTSIGIEARKEQILSTSLGNKIRLPVKINGTDSAYFTNSYDRNTAGWFLEQNYIFNNFSVTGGFLLNINKDYRHMAGFFPGVDISYNFSDKRAKVFASVNRSLRLPTFTDMFYNDPSNEGNFSLNPEELIAFETGVEYKYKEVSAGLTLFRDQGKHVIDWIWLPDRQIYKAMNITEVTTRGIEITGEYHSHINKEKLFRLNKMGTSYTFIHLEKASGTFESKYSLDYLRHKLRFYLTYDFSKRLHSNWQLSYLSRNGSYIDYDKSTNSRFSSSFKPYCLVDSKLYYEFSKINIYIEASNLLNTKYTDVGNLIQPGRWISGGIQLGLPKM